MSLLLLMDDETAKFDPYLTPNFAWWLDDNDAVGVVGDVGTLDYVPCKLGSNKRKGGNTDRRPDIDSRTLNGRKVANYVRVTDTDGEISNSTNFPDFTNTGDYTIIQLFQCDIPTADGARGFAGHQGGSQTFGFSLANFATKIGVGFGGGTGFQIDWNQTTTPHIIVLRREGTLLEAWLDGTVYGSANNGANVNMTHGFLWGREEASGGRGYWDGTLPEQRAFTGRAITRQEINDHCNDIKKVWGASVPWTNIS